jgi:RNA polymerase sigma factor (TIGR02999 family)
MEASMQDASKNTLTSSVGEITLLLSGTKNPDALRTVMQLAYDELHSIAARHCYNEPPGRSLQPTALVSEACIRLIKDGAVFQNRRHFFGAASKAMRRAIVDSARRRRAKKRGGDWQRVDFAEAERIGFERPSELLDFDAALARLERLQPRLCEIAELRVFGELSTKEIATILDIGQSTARRRWAKAKKWLREAIANPGRLSCHVRIT